MESEYVILLLARSPNFLDFLRLTTIRTNWRIFEPFIIGIIERHKIGIVKLISLIKNIIQNLTWSI